MPLLKFLPALLILMSATMTHAAELTHKKDADSGFEVYTAKVGNTTARLVPEAGCNLFSIEFYGIELLKTPKSLKELPGFMYGNPVLYPMPNRVRDSQFTFGGQTYKFTPNNNGNFLHGLVHNVPWKVTKSVASEKDVVIVCELPFEPGSEHFKLFPHRHTVRLETRITDGATRFTYTVDNGQGDKPVPFGMAYHPWFLYQGKRENTFLTIPATHVFEADPALLPTGKLNDVTGTKFDARAGKSLGGFVIDDVFSGMKSDKPAVIDYRDAKLKISFPASDDFTHLVVYTPEQPWFCVENQTCSTDAHNLHARGLKTEAHLLIVEPGKSHTGFAEFKFEKY